MKKSTTVAGYIKAAPAQAQAKLKQMRACIRDAAPKATEELKWGMPAYSGKRILVIFGGFTHHIGFYPTTSAVKAFQKDLKKYKQARRSIQFLLSEPLPLPLIKKMTKFRVQESILEDKKLKTGGRKKM